MNIRSILHNQTLDELMSAAGTVTLAVAVKQRFTNPIPSSATLIKSPVGIAGMGVMLWQTSQAVDRLYHGDSFDPKGDALLVSSTVLNVGALMCTNLPHIRAALVLASFGLDVYNCWNVGEKWQQGQLTTFDAVLQLGLTVLFASDKKNIDTLSDAASRLVSAGNHRQVAYAHACQHGSGNVMMAKKETPPNTYVNGKKINPKTDFPAFINTSIPRDIKNPKPFPEVEQRVKAHTRYNKKEALAEGTKLWNEMISYCDNYGQLMYEIKTQLMGQGYNLQGDLSPYSVAFRFCLEALHSAGVRIVAQTPIHEVPGYCIGTLNNIPLESLPVSNRPQQKIYKPYNTKKLKDVWNQKLDDAHRKSEPQEHELSCTSVRHDGIKTPSQNRQTMEANAQKEWNAWMTQNKNSPTYATAFTQALHLRKNEEINRGMAHHLFGFFTDLFVTQGVVTDKKGFIQLLDEALPKQIVAHIDGRFQIVDEALAAQILTKDIRASMRPSRTEGGWRGSQGNPWTDEPRTGAGADRKGPGRR